MAKRKGRTDPLLALLVIFSAVAGLWLLPRRSSNAGPLSALLSWLPAACALLAGLAAIGPVRQLWRTATAVRRKAQALKGLPGPSYGVLGVLLLLRKMRVHRQAQRPARLS